MSSTHLQSVFSIAHTDLHLAPFNNHGRTLRLVVPLNVEARGFSVRLSNLRGESPLPIGAASLAICSPAGVLDPATLVPLTVNGTLSFELAPGEEVLSDMAALCALPGDHLAINIYYPTPERVVSGNWVSIEALRSNKGNFSADAEISAPGLVSRFARTVVASDITVEATTVSDVIAHCEKPGRVLACFGDSITQQGNWTEPLTKLLHHQYPGQISLCNLGISGNRLLRDSGPTPIGAIHGQAGINRFDHDVLGISGLTHCTVLIGTNDIGQPGAGGLPDSDVPTLEEYTAAMTQIAEKLHARKVKAYVCTLTPRAIVAPFTAQREELRLAMNNWIRTSGVFDAVIDFDEALRQADGAPGMKDGCHLPDGLHPSPLGGMVLAKCIDLSLFA